MGGRVALHAALRHRDAVERLVLIGATPGIANAAERRARRAADDALADHIEAVGVAAFIDEWLTNPLFAGLTEANGTARRSPSQHGGRPCHRVFGSLAPAPRSHCGVGLLTLRALSC